MPNYRTNEDRRSVDSPQGVNIVHDTTVAALSAPVVTIAEFKIFARLEGFTPVGGPEDTFTYDDAKITQIIATATDGVEKESGQLVKDRAVTDYVTNECGGLRLSYGPVTSAAITATDEDLSVISDIKTFGGQYKQLLTTGTRMIVSYTAGHTACPAWMKEAILRQSLYLYTHLGEDDKGICYSAKVLIQKNSKRSWLV